MRRLRIKFYKLPPLDLCFLTPQPCTNSNFVFHHENEEVDIANMTMGEQELYELARSKKESGEVDIANLSMICT